jgi:hypothetical protein
MQYEPDTERVTMMTTPHTLVPQVISQANDPQIQHTRKILLIILGVYLVSVFDEDRI